MGSKRRAFAPPPAVTLDDLVPAAHCYRHLERTLDLAFVRDLVRDCYKAGGRAGIVSSSGKERSMILPYHVSHALKQPKSS